MSNAEAMVQVNLKSGVGYDATLINVYAKTPDELVTLLNAVKQHAPLIAEAQAVVKLSHGIEVQQGSVQSQQEVPAQQGFSVPQMPNVGPPPTQQDNAGWGAPQQQQAPPQWSQPAQYQSDGGPETDKWGNTWEYGRPDAPATPRGPAVLKSGTSREGKGYKRWEDPAKGPRWYAQRQPKVDDSQLWPGEFFKGR